MSTKTLQANSIIAALLADDIAFDASDLWGDGPLDAYDDNQPSAASMLAEYPYEVVRLTWEDGPRSRPTERLNELHPTMAAAEASRDALNRAIRANYSVDRSSNATGDAYVARAATIESLTGWGYGK